MTKVRHADHAPSIRTGVQRPDGEQIDGNRHGRGVPDRTASEVRHPGLPVRLTTRPEPTAAAAAKIEYWPYHHSSATRGVVTRYGPLGIAAAAGVALYFLGAVGAHLRKGDVKGIVTPGG